MAKYAFFCSLYDERFTFAQKGSSISSLILVYFNENISVWNILKVL